MLVITIVLITKYGGKNKILIFKKITKKKVIIIKFCRLICIIFYAICVQRKLD